MTPDPRTRLIALLMRVSPDLAARVWLVDDLREPPPDVKGQCLDVIGRKRHGLRRHAERGLGRDATGGSWFRASARFRCVAPAVQRA